MAFGFDSYAQDAFSTSGGGPVNVTVSATGVAGTTNLGVVTTKFDMVFEVTGVQATGAIGTVNAGAGVLVFPTGVSATAELGNETVFVGILVPVNNTNLLMTAELGTAEAVLPITAEVTGVSATAHLGQETVVAGNVIAKPRGDETFNVTVANGGSGNVYYLNYFMQTTLDSLHPPFTYRFDLSDSSTGGHPLRFSTTADGTHGGGTEYTTGVTVNGVAGNPGAYVEITLTDSTPQLYVYCANHSGMGFMLDMDYNAEIIGNTALNSVTIKASILIPVNNSGMNVFGIVGDVNVTGTALITPTGVSATGFISSGQVPAVNVWQVIDDSQTPGWTEIAA